MSAAPRNVLRAAAGAGQVALVVLGLCWVALERPAPLVNVRWRAGLPDDVRTRHEAALHLARGERSDDTWRYELTAPRTDVIRAILTHPDVADTHRLERASATISPDAGTGTLRVWWAGPLRGAGGPRQFRLLYGTLGLLVLLASWAARERPAAGSGARTPGGAGQAPPDIP